MTAPCAICEKHQHRGPLVGPPMWDTELVVVSHRGPEPDGFGMPGYVLLETRRHVERWDLMTAAEVAALAEAAWQAARCLRALLTVDGVYTAIIGRQIDHVHQHVFARHDGTPAEIGWLDSLTWPGVPRASSVELDEFAQRLAAERDRLATVSAGRSGSGAAATGRPPTG